MVRELGTLVSGISDDCANVRKQWPQATEQQVSRLSVGDVGWLHSACDQQPEGVHQNAALAAFHALVRIESPECRRVLWSLPTDRPIMTTEGQAARPACRRACWYIERWIQVTRVEIGHPEGYLR